MAHSSIIFKILTTISKNTFTIYDVFESLLSIDCSASIYKEDKKENKRHLQQYVSKLVRDDLIKKTKDNYVSLTSHGLAKLKKLKSIPRNHDFKIEESPHIIIISFDIPEKYRRSRNHLRELLKCIDFKLVHKSTWFGKTKIPEELLKKLEKMEILKYIKIFEVTKSGTLEIVLK